MDSVLSAVKVGLIAWGYLILAMGIIFCVLVIIKKIGKKGK